MSENETWGMEDKKGACISLFFMGGNKKTTYMAGCPQQFSPVRAVIRPGQRYGK